MNKKCDERTVKMIENIVELIKKYDTIIIHRHKKPDGDALGSQIGLKNIILDNFEGKTVYVVGDHAGRYAFMDGSEMDEIADECYNGALAFVLDTSAKSLISDDRYTLADATVRMDHHIFVEKICDTELTDTSYESCCGLITDFADRAGLKLSSASAKALYTGMVTDSGRFRYDSTTSSNLCDYSISYQLSIPASIPASCIAFPTLRFSFHDRRDMYLFGLQKRHHRRMFL